MVTPTKPGTRLLAASRQEQRALSESWAAWRVYEPIFQGPTVHGSGSDLSMIDMKFAHPNAVPIVDIVLQQLSQSYLARFEENKLAQNKEHAPWNAE